MNYAPMIEYNPRMYYRGDPLHDGTGLGIGANKGRGGCPPEEQIGGIGRNPGKGLDSLI